MARSLNKCLLIGNVGQDPEVKTIPSGARVANFSLATSQKWKGKDGQPNERTEWHRIIVWDKLAENVVEPYVKKGDRLYVEGEIEYRQYQDKDGVTKYATEIRAREIVLLGGKGEGTGERQAPQTKKAPSDYATYEAPSFEEDSDGDLFEFPF